MKLDVLLPKLRILSDQFESVNFIEHGPFDFKDGKFDKNDEMEIRSRKLFSGVYLICNTNEDVMYVGVSDNSMTDRIYKELQRSKMENILESIIQTFLKDMLFRLHLMFLIMLLRAWPLQCVQKLMGLALCYSIR